MKDTNNSIKNGFIHFIKMNRLVSLNFMTLLVCFFLPFLTAQDFNPKINKLEDGLVFYGGYNLFAYSNLIVLVWATFVVFSREFKNYNRFVWWSIFYLILYTLIFVLGKDLPLGNTSSSPKLGIGYILNLSSTFLIFGILFIKVYRRASVQNR